MDNKDKLIHRMLALDLIRLNQDLKEFNKIIAEFKNVILNTDFSQDFSDESLSTFNDIAILMNEMIKAINYFENSLINLSNSIKNKVS